MKRDMEFSDKNNVEGDSVDLISVDEVTQCVVLHLLFKGEWNSPENQLQWIRRRLNLYLGFVLSGQLAGNPQYQGLSVKFLIHCESVPPTTAITTFSHMRLHMIKYKIGFGVTVGSAITKEITLEE
jgi:hypothetical protein